VSISVAAIDDVIPIELRERGGSVSRSDGLMALHAMRALWALR
jgi:hypothetical protein